jgi:hypothetical protein
MTKEALTIIGIQGNNRWSKASISAEDLPRLFKDEGLSYLDIKPSEDNPGIHPKKYLDVLIPESVFRQLILEIPGLGKPKPATDNSRLLDTLGKMYL